MMAPVSAGTLSRVSVAKRNHAIPASAAGNAEIIRKRIEPRLKIHHDEQVDQQNRKHQPAQQADIRLLHRLTLSAQNDVRAARQLLFVFRFDPFHLPRYGPEVSAFDVGINVQHRLHVVVAHRTQFRPWLQLREIAEDL